MKPFRFILFTLLLLSCFSMTLSAEIKQSKIIQPCMIRIIAEDLDANGFGSAAVDHAFKYESDVELSSISWEYSLQKVDGTFDLQKTSSAATFNIPKVSSSEGFYIDSNGNLSGKITVCGKDSDGNLNSDTYHAYLGLKPVITDVRNIKQIPTGEFTFILQFDVEYLGADFLNISIESENSSKLNEWKYTEPTLVHFKTTELYNFYYHWVDILAHNKYGTTVKTLEFPDTYNPESQENSQYFIRLSSPQYVYEINNDSNLIKGDFSFDVITNYPDGIFVEITTPNMQHPWLDKYPVEHYPVYERFRFNYSAENGYKIKATIPQEKIESNVLIVDDFISQEDLEAISGVETVSSLDDLGNKLRKQQD